MNIEERLMGIDQLRKGAFFQRPVGVLNFALGSPQLHRVEDAHSGSPALKRLARFTRPFQLADRAIGPNSAGPPEGKLIDLDLPSCFELPVLLSDVTRHDALGERSPIRPSDGGVYRPNHFDPTQPDATNPSAPALKLQAPWTRVKADRPFIAHPLGV